MRKPGRTGASPDTEAANWYARLSSDQCTPEDRARFDAWHADPSNSAAFARMEATLAQMDALKRDTAALLALKLPSPGQPSAPPRALMVGTAAAVAAALAIAAVVIQMPGASPQTEPAQLAEAVRYEAGPGEIAQFTLPDQSALHIGSGSAVTVRYTSERRDVLLEQGLAYFEVAPDPFRPFEVRARSRSVVAIGTSFDVRLDGDRVEVTLVEGSVAIGSSLAGRQITLRPDERYTFDGIRETVMPIDAAADTAWRSGMLQFTDASLAEAVDRFNRHSARHLHLKDEALARMRIGGRFRTNDADAFAAALEALYPIRPEKRANGDIELIQRND